MQLRNASLAFLVASFTATATVAEAQGYQRIALGETRISVAPGSSTSVGGYCLDLGLPFPDGEALTNVLGTTTAVDGTSALADAIARGDITVRGGDWPNVVFTNHTDHAITVDISSGTVLSSSPRDLTDVRPEVLDALTPGHDDAVQDRIWYLLNQTTSNVFVDRTAEGFDVTLVDTTHAGEHVFVADESLLAAEVARLTAGRRSVSIATINMDAGATRALQDSLRVRAAERSETMRVRAAVGLEAAGLGEFAATPSRAGETRLLRGRRLETEVDIAARPFVAVSVVEFESAVPTSLVARLRSGVNGRISAIADGRERPIGDLATDVCEAVAAEIAEVRSTAPELPDADILFELRRGAQTLRFSVVVVDGVARWT